MIIYENETKISIYAIAHSHTNEWAEETSKRNEKNSNLKQWTIAFNLAIIINVATSAQYGQHFEHNPLRYLFIQVFVGVSSVRIGSGEPGVRRCFVVEWKIGFGFSSFLFLKSLRCQHSNALWIREMWEREHRTSDVAIHHMVQQCNRFLWQFASNTIVALSTRHFDPHKRVRLHGTERFFSALTFVLLFSFAGPRITSSLNDTLDVDAYTEIGWQRMKRWRPAKNELKVILQSSFVVDRYYVCLRVRLEPSINVTRHFNPTPFAIQYSNNGHFLFSAHFMTFLRVNRSARDQNIY